VVGRHNPNARLPSRSADSSDPRVRRQQPLLSSLLPREPLGWFGPHGTWALRVGKRRAHRRPRPLLRGELLRTRRKSDIGARWPRLPAQSRRLWSGPGECSSCVAGAGNRGRAVDRHARASAASRRHDGRHVLHRSAIERPSRGARCVGPPVAPPVPARGPRHCAREPENRRAGRLRSWPTAASR
jgi:hypothetical protein